MNRHEKIKAALERVAAAKLKVQGCIHDLETTENELLQLLNQRPDNPYETLDGPDHPPYKPPGSEN